MNPFVFGIKNPEHGWLEPAVHELIRLAQQEATQRGAREVSLEHLLLGTLVQNDVRVLSLFVALGLEPASLRERILGRLGLLHAHEDTSELVPLSQELQICFDLAIAATHASGTMLVSVERLLLCVLSNQWKLLSDKLIERLVASGEWDELIPICGELAHQERRLLFYVQNLVHHLSRFQEATHSFTDLPGLATTKHELRSVITQVVAPLDPALGRRKPQEVLLLGVRSDAVARRLAEAVAGELGTRLLSFSFSGLVTMCTPFTTYLEVQHRKDERISAQDMCFSRYGIVLAQRVLQRFFNRVHLMSTCVLLFENLDASDFSGHTSVNEIRAQLLALLFVEIEQLTEGEQIIILATATSGIDGVFQRLEEKKMCHAQHFERRLVIDDDISLLAASSPVCSGCQRQVAAHWKHCVYCSVPLAHKCPQCGSLRLSMDGATFCYECGNALD